MNNLIMPAYYSALSFDDMVYVEGGVTKEQAFCAWFVPFYGWYKGITAVRDYRNANPEDWILPGLTALCDDMEKDIVNSYYDLGCAFHVVGTTFTGIGFLINAAIILA
ncbi:MAG: hypothetical protein SOV03_06495 [Faecalibacterium sp.]|nr:hypothetical protein [Faecalibacterium sp.]